MKRDRETIFKKIFVPLLFVMLLQIVLFFLIIYRGGVINRLKENAYDILQERVINRKNELETRFNLNWTNLDSTVTALDTLYGTASADLKEGDFLKEEEQKQFLLASSDALIRVLRQNEVNGVFLILEDGSAAEGGKTYRHGLCIRDLDVNSDYVGREDLMLDRAPASMISDLGIKLDSWWESFYTFEDGSSHGDYYFKPLEAALDNPGASYDDLAYLCAPHKMSGIDTEMISYSVPLLGRDGRPYGVLGIEISTSYLATLIPSTEISGHGSGSYCLAKNVEGSSEYEPWVTEGMFFQQYFHTDKPLVLTNQVAKNCYEVTSDSRINVTMESSQLKIYNQNTPFESERILLLGMQRTDELMNFSTGILRAVTIAGGLALLLSLVGILIISRSLSVPLRALADQVKDMKPEADLSLKRLGISEIDQLEESIEVLSRNVSENQAKTEFFSRMSHDMRTPMNAVIGFSSPDLTEQADEETLKDYMEKIHSSGNYLLGLINEVLDMTKIQSGRMTFHEEPIAPRELWANTLPIIEEIAEQRKVDFVKILPCDRRNEYVLGDRQRIQQILVNLLSNAVKFTAPGGTVTLNSEELGERDGKILYRIQVKDNGIGMSEEFQKRLFTPFEQENPGREGTGLGLSITKELIEQMGGKISFISKKGVGTEFTVELAFAKTEPPVADRSLPDRNPAEKGEPPGTAENQTADPAAAGTAENQTADPAAAGTADGQTAGRAAAVYPQLAGKRILVCEDHPLNRQIATALLKKQGILVECAENGKKGVELLAASAPGYYDAVLMDVRMPIMNGLEATRAIRALERPDAQTIPIIAMTANAFKEDMDASKAAGMNRHLSKPIEPQLLYGTLAEFLGKSD